MRKFLLAAATVIAIAGSQSAYAGRDEFCAGFAEGFKTVKGDIALVPLCPLEPLTPLGSTPFREGIKAGIVAAGK
jgi:hypothetical protein